MAKQIIRVVHRKDGRMPKRGIAVHKSSIGIMYINGVRYAFNEDKLLTNRIEFDDAVDGIDTKKAKKKIYIRRRWLEAIFWYDRKRC